MKEHIPTTASGTATRAAVMRTLLRGRVEVESSSLERTAGINVSSTAPPSKQNKKEASIDLAARGNFRSTQGRATER